MYVCLLSGPGREVKHNAYYMLKAKKFEKYCLTVLLLIEFLIRTMEPIEIETDFLN